jgi:transaldolase
LKPKTLADLNVAIFADGADRAGMLEMYQAPYVKGFTTNPTLMRRAGISDYLDFATSILRDIKDRPISFEVFADEPKEMLRQARILAALGENVSVKIPITSTAGAPMGNVIRELTDDGISVNVTAMMTTAQLVYVLDHIGATERTCYASIFAGRIADTGVDPVPLMAEAVRLVRTTPNVDLIWASCREVWNIFQADAIGCDVITVTNDILAKLPTVGKELTAYSLDTVRSFYADSAAAGFRL